MPVDVAHMSPRRTRATLAVMALSLMTVVSAVSGLNVALPSLARATGASQTELTWIVDAYTVVFAGLLLFAGALGDRFGRKPLLIVGLIVFGAAAAGAFFAEDPAVLIALRAGMGIGAAAIMPTTLSVITSSFPEEERPKAIGVWVGVVGGGAVLGLFATGLLLEWFEWNSFFALNIALATLGLIGTLAVVPNSRDSEPPAFDVLGALLSLVGVGGLVAGIIEGPERGWTDAVTLGCLISGAIAAVVFVFWELHLEHPLLDPRLFRIRAFSSATLTITVQFFCAFGLFFTLLQYLQFVTDLTPLKATAYLLPLPFIMIPLARQTPHIAQRVGFRRLVPLGLVCTSVGLFILSRLSTELSFWHIFAGLIFFGLGMALAGTPSTSAITQALPVSKQGVASAVNDVSREVGSAFGIAILGSALNEQYRTGMSEVLAGLPQVPAEAAERIKATIAFTQSEQVRAAGPIGQQLIDAGHTSFLDGVGTALLTASGVALVAAVAVWLLSPAPTSPRAHRSAQIRDAS